jgi:hypothetical protein
VEVVIVPHEVEVVIVPHEVEVVIAPHEVEVVIVPHEVEVVIVPHEVGEGTAAEGGGRGWWMTPYPRLRFAASAVLSPASGGLFVVPPP